jgi:hypothetical protein
MPPGAKDAIQVFTQLEQMPPGAKDVLQLKIRHMTQSRFKTGFLKNVTQEERHSGWPPDAKDIQEDEEEEAQDEACPLTVSAFPLKFERKSSNHERNSPRPRHGKEFRCNAIVIAGESK